MRLIDADGIKYTKDSKGNTTVSKEEIQKMQLLLILSM